MVYETPSLSLTEMTYLPSFNGALFDHKNVFPWLGFLILISFSECLFGKFGFHLLHETLQSWRQHNHSHNLVITKTADLSYLQAEPSHVLSKAWEVLKRSEGKSCPQHLDHCCLGSCLIFTLKTTLYFHVQIQNLYCIFSALVSIEWYWSVL